MSENCIIVWIWNWNIFVYTKDCLRSFSPSDVSRKAVINYWWKYLNKCWLTAQRTKHVQQSVIRLTDRLDSIFNSVDDWDVNLQQTITVCQGPFHKALRIFERRI